MQKKQIKKQKKNVLQQNDSESSERKNNNLSLKSRSLSPQKIINQFLTSRNEQLIGRFKILSSIGIPAMILNEDKVNQYIILHKKEIQEGNINIIKPIIGIIGESYLGFEDNSTDKYKFRLLQIYKMINKLFYQQNITINKEFLNKLIVQTLFIIIYPIHQQITFDSKLNTLEKYETIWKTLCIVQKYNNDELNHNFIQHCFIQTDNNVDLSEICDIQQLQTIRFIRDTIRKIMCCLNEIQNLNLEVNEQLGNKQINGFQECSKLDSEIELFWKLKQSLMRIEDHFYPQITTKYDELNTQRLKIEILQEILIKEQEHEIIQKPIQIMYPKKSIQIKFKQSNITWFFQKKTNEQ